MKEYIKFWKHLGNSGFKYTKSLNSYSYYIEKDLYTKDYKLPNKLKVVYTCNNFEDAELQKYLLSNNPIGLLQINEYEYQMNIKGEWYYFMPLPDIITVYDN